MGEKVDCQITACCSQQPDHVSQKKIIFFFNKTTTKFTNLNWLTAGTITCDQASLYFRGGKVREKRKVGTPDRRLQVQLKTECGSVLVLLVMDTDSVRAASAIRWSYT